MKKMLDIFIVLSVSLGFCFPVHALKKPEIMTTTADIASITSKLLGEYGNVNSLMNGGENPVFFVPERRKIMKSRQADFFLKNGKGLEYRWEKKFYQDAKNPAINVGANGNITVTGGIKTLPIKTTKTFILDIYKEGNPFVWLDPVNGKVIANNVADYFCSVYPHLEKEIRSNLVKFNKTIDQKLVTWTKKMSPHHDQKIIAYQHNFDYFAKRFNVKIVDYLESEYEVPPSEKRIQAIIAKIKEQNISLLLMANYNSRRIPNRIAEETGIKLLVLPSSVGNDWIKNYVQLFDYLINSFDQAMKQFKKTE